MIDLIYEVIISGALYAIDYDISDIMLCNWQTLLYSFEYGTTNTENTAKTRMEKTMGIHTFENDENKNKYLSRLVEARGDKSQQDLANDHAYPIFTHATISKYEKGKAYPTIDNFIDMCDYYDKDPNYLLGFSDVDSVLHKKLSEHLHISAPSILILKNSPYAGKLVNILLSQSIYDTIDQQIRWLSHHKRLQEVLETAFRQQLIDKLRNLFNDYYENTPPMNYSEENFVTYIRKHNLLFKGYASAEEFIDKYFLDEGKNFIYNGCENFADMSRAEQFEEISNVLSFYAFHTFMHEPHIEKLRERLAANIMKAIDLSLE